MSEALVSVCIITYNHANYIQQCLDSVLNQKTNFEFNIFVSDDCSTDSTLQILNDYSKKFPFIHVKSRCGLPKSQFSGKPTGNLNLIENIERSNGKFIATLDGDDFWDDPYKLQRQVDALNSNEDCPLVCTRKRNLTGDKVKSPFISFPPISYSYRLLFFYNPIPSSSVMFRRSAYQRRLEDYNSLPVGDWPLWFSICYGSHFIKLAQTSLVYRVHSSGAWGGVKRSAKATNASITLNALKKSYGGVIFNFSLFLHRIRYMIARSFEILTTP